MTRTLLASIALLALAACGSRDVLKPAPGTPMPVKPAAARTTPTVDELLELPANARPGRSDELLRRSQERPDDRFDLPPPD